MYPHERSLVKNLAGKPFAIIGVNSDRDIEIPQKLVKDGTVTWRSFQDDGPDTKISESWGVRGWPTVYVLDAEGKIRFKNVRGKKIDEAVKTLFEEMGEEFPEIDYEAEREAEEKIAEEQAAAEKEAIERTKDEKAKAKAEKEATEEESDKDK